MVSRVIFAVSVVLAASYLVQPSHAVLSDDDKEEILKAHNLYRSKAYPTPTDMVALEWDSELAALAQFWTVECTMEANENRHEQSTDYDYVGEILYSTANYSVNLTTMVSVWFNEGINYDYSQGACLDEDGEADDDDEECARYIQLTWAQSYKVGCGRYSCEEVEGFEEDDNDDDDGDDDDDDDDADDDDDDEVQTIHMFACNYGPGGGYAGVRPYQSGGDACSSCPSSYSICENGLCVSSTGGATSIHQLSIALLVAVTAAFSAMV